MPIYWIVTEGVFHEPVARDDSEASSDGAKPFLGFLMALGCTADDEEEARRRATDHVVEHSRDLAEFELHVETVDVMGESDLRQTVYSDESVKAALRHDPREWGLWYASERGFYSEDDEGDDEDESSDA